MVESIFPLAVMEEAMKEGGAPRVSHDAKVALRDFLEGYAKEICDRAVSYAKHSGRNTIKEEDIKLAAAEKKL